MGYLFLLSLKCEHKCGERSNSKNYQGGSGRNGMSVYFNEKLGRNQFFFSGTWHSSQWNSSPAITRIPTAARPRIAAIQSTPISWILQSMNCTKSPMEIAAMITTMARRQVISFTLHDPDLIMGPPPFYPVPCSAQKSGIGNRGCILSIERIA